MGYDMKDGSAVFVMIASARSSSIAVLESNHGLTCGCHYWLVQQCDPIQTKLLTTPI